MKSLRLNALLIASLAIGFGLSSCKKEDNGNGGSGVPKSQATHFSVTKIEVNANYPNGEDPDGKPDVYVVILDGSNEVFNNINNYVTDSQSATFNVGEVLLAKNKEYTIQLWDHDVNENDDLLGVLNITPDSAPSGDNPPLEWDSFTVFAKFSGVWK